EIAALRARCEELEIGAAVASEKIAALEARVRDADAVSPSSTAEDAPAAAEDPSGGDGGQDEDGDAATTAVETTMSGVTSEAATDIGEEESGAQRELLEKRLREAEEAAQEAAREM
ncbi:unnamed protein product, partial [Ectocarpus sp. 12 AP-2014]